MILDESDARLLRAVQAAPDATVGELAEMVGLSQTPCWRRLKRLETSGVIAGRAVMLDRKAVGLDVDVFAYLRLRQHDEATLNAFEQSVEALPEIVECFLMSGDSDYLVRIVTDSIESYERLLKKTLLHLPGVAAVNSSFALKSVKMSWALPLPA